jgi:SAM-dependent methyltransferase
MVDKIYEINSFLSNWSNKTTFKDGNKSLYGETTKKGVDDIVNHFKGHFNKDTVFYDLGCGMGKMVAHIGIQYNPKKSCGIELSKERLKCAFEIKEKYCKDDTTINYIEGDFYKMDLSDATVVYFDNTAMWQKKYVINLYNKLPKGCLLIYRSSGLRISEIREYNQNKTEEKNKFITTYGSDTLFYMVIK